MLIENCVVGLKVIVNNGYHEKNSVRYIIDFKRELKKGQFVTNSEPNRSEGSYTIFYEMEPWSLTK